MQNRLFGRMKVIHVSWNYRVVKEFRKDIKPPHNVVYRVVEVIYDKDGNIDGWCDCTDSILRWDNPKDLRDTAISVQKAFDKPILLVGEDNYNLTTIDEDYERGADV